MSGNNQKLEDLAAKVIEAQSLLTRAVVIVSDVQVELNKILNNRIKENENGDETLVQKSG